MENKILVFGDEVVDWIDIPRKPESSEPNKSNWELTPGTNRVAIGGGTFLIVDLLREIYKGKETIVGPDWLKVRKRNSRIQSYMRINEFTEEKKGQKKEPFWRVKEFMGYGGPKDPQQSEIEINKGDVFKTVIIDDAANGIRNSGTSNEILNKVTKPDTIVYKLARPLNTETPGLWESVLKKQESEKFNLVVLLDANDLRNEGAAISHGLSWERFGSDVVHFFTYTNHFTRFKSFKGWIVIKAGLEGAVILPPDFRTDKQPEGKSPILIYNPVKGEDDGYDEYREKGKMTGYFSVFTAAIGKCLNSSESFSDECLIQAVKTGLFASNKLLEYGFLVDVHCSSAKYPIRKISEEIIKNDVGNFQKIDIPQIHENYSIHKRIWTIIETFKLKEIVGKAVDLVKFDDKDSNVPIPCAKFGKFITYDPFEIENFRTVKRLVREYLDAGVLDRPLSVGVFGKPGSGKSFGVKEVVSSLLPGETQVKTFNLSEFQTVDELSRAFHIVHDLTRDGTFPLIFFDEFDCSLNGEKCGWLKYFLAPMQDGKFNDGSDIHPIGRAIFVFAGGTKNSYESFAEQEAESDQDFIKAKGPDFLSRLRGFVNILGVNPANDKDFICLIRRATILRGNILSRAKTLGKQSHWLVNEKNQIIIEDAVLHTLLKIPDYKNGARSLSAIIESCQLSLSKGLTKASLPPVHILSMHVDTKRFNELLYAEDPRQKIFIPARETMARIVHENYRKANKGAKNDIQWEKLSVFEQQQNCYQVDYYADMLATIGLILEIKKDDEPYSLTDNDIIQLSKAEHNRWMTDKISQGFKKGEERSNYFMTHPDIVDWEDLKPEEQQKDSDAMKAIPELVSISGLTIVKKT